MNQQEMKAMQDELAKLKAENEKLKAKNNHPISFKVSEKKAVSVYGLGRFPVTLYVGQWEKFLGRIDDFKKFLVENDRFLSRDKVAAPTDNLPAVQPTE